MEDFSRLLFLLWCAVVEESWPLALLISCSPSLFACLHPFSDTFFIAVTPPPLPRSALWCLYCISFFFLLASSRRVCSSVCVCVCSFFATTQFYYSNSDEYELAVLKKQSENLLIRSTFGSNVWCFSLRLSAGLRWSMASWSSCLWLWRFYQLPVCKVKTKSL